MTEVPHLQAADLTKHLGLFIDSSLSWQDHIDALCSRFSSSLFTIKITKAISIKETTKKAYHALFESHLRYGRHIAVWGGASLSNMDRVLKIQKRAIRMVGLNCHESSRRHFKESQIPTVIILYITEATSQASSRKLLRNGNLLRHNTRCASDFHLPAHKLKTFEKKPSYNGAPCTINYHKK